ncbi:MAG: fimbria/pilus periplasmic chaperone [Candidatus Dasytiphilus stammeri]
MHTKSLLYYLLGVILSYLITCNSSLLANSSILIWPLDPVIEADQNAASLWLENHSANSILIQIRVFSWKQKNNDNQLLEQHEIIISPPMVEILPKNKQLIRLIKNITPPQDHEWSYRILIDEIPQDIIEPTKDKMGLTFKMRYSIPLFLNGKNIIGGIKPNYQSLRTFTATQPRLYYRIITKNGKKLLIIHNKGLVHAKVTDIMVLNEKTKDIINNGFFGYILPKSEIFIPFSTIIPKGFLVARVNDNLQFQQLIPEC